MVGGLTGFGNYANSVLALMPRATSWKAMTSLPKGLAAIGSAMVNGQLWVTGGVDSGSKYNSDVSASIHFMSHHLLLISPGFCL